MNDYTCPRCKGMGKIQHGILSSMFKDCPDCRGDGRLLDRRGKTISDRRKYDGPGMERRKNFTFTDRRKKI